MSNSALENLMDNVINTDEMAEDYKVCPELEEVSAEIETASISSGKSPNIDSNSAGIWANLNITWSIDSEEAREEIGRDKVLVRQGLFIAITDDADGNPTFSMTDNVPLAKLLKMLDVTGELSLTEIEESLPGNTAMVKVEHDTFDKDGEDQTVAKVTSAWKD